MSNKNITVNETKECYPPGYADPKPQTVDDADGKFLHKFGDSLYLSPNEPETVLARVPLKADQALQNYSFTGTFQEIKDQPDQFRIKGCKSFDSSIVLCDPTQEGTKFKWNSLDPTLAFIESIKAANDKKINCQYNTSEEQLCSNPVTRNIAGLGCSKSLSGGAIAGIVISCVVFVGGFIYWWVFFRKRPTMESASQQRPSISSEKTESSIKLGQQTPNELERQASASFINVPVTRKSAEVNPLAIEVIDVEESKDIGKKPTAVEPARSQMAALLMGNEAQDPEIKPELIKSAVGSESNVFN